MILMSGKEVAEAIKPLGGTDKHLLILMVKGNKDAEVYAKSLIKLAKELSIPAETLLFDKDVTKQQLQDALDDYDISLSKLGSIMILNPFPKVYKDTFLPLFDIDNVIYGKTWLDGLDELGGTPQAVGQILKYYNIELKGKNVVVIGRSDNVGLPIANYLISQNATVTVCHSKTADLASHTKNADIIVSAVGKAGLITPDMVKEGVVIVDVGINFKDGKICGDVDPAVMEKASAFTPVPGGVGVVSNMCIMRNHLKASLYA